MGIFFGTNGNVIPNNKFSKTETNMQLCISVDFIFDDFTIFYCGGMFDYLFDIN